MHLFLKTIAFSLLITVSIVFVYKVCGFLNDEFGLFAFFGMTMINLLSLD
jgi:hypothetical protein